MVNGEARDPRCENCMMHCGYEPTASLGLQAKPGDTWKNIKFNFAPRPKTVSAAGVQAFNGVSAGKGHKTGSQEDKSAATHAHPVVAPGHVVAAAKGASVEVCEPAGV